MFASMEKKPNGKTEIINFVPQGDGTLVRHFPNTNAVLVQIIPLLQPDGTVENTRVMSILCADEDMLPALREEAERLMYV